MIAPWGFDARNPLNVPTVRDPYAANNPAPVFGPAPGRAFVEGGWWIVAVGVLLVATAGFVNARR